MMVWGNYCNVMGGAHARHIYYSTDSGRTVKIAYAFGRNPHFRDDGSPGGGATGMLLGDPGNPVLARHVHTVAYNPVENAFYACTGDWIAARVTSATGSEGPMTRTRPLGLEVLVSANSTRDTNAAASASSTAWHTGSATPTGRGTTLMVPWATIGAYSAALPRILPIPRSIPAVQPAG